MKVNEILTEAVSSRVFHFTSIYNAYKILSQRKLALTPAVGSSIETKMQSGKIYFLSLARSPSADYTISSSYDNGVIFNFNGDWFNQRHKGKAVDYWERMWLADRTAALAMGVVTKRTSEQEDRVLSDEPIINFPSNASDLLLSVHILAADKDAKTFEKRKGILRGVIFEAKRMGVPVYVYDNRQKWLIQDTRANILDSDFIASLTGDRPSSGRMTSMRFRDNFKKWRELYYKTDKEQLSKEALKELYNMFNYSDRARVLETDIHNSRKDLDPNLDKLLAIFKKIDVRTADQYILYLKKKWLKAGF